MGALVLMMTAAALAAAAVTIARGIRSSEWKSPVSLLVIVGAGAVLMFVLAGLETRAGAAGGVPVIEEWVAGAEARVTEMAGAVFPGSPVAGGAGWEEEPRTFQVSRSYVGEGNWELPAVSAGDAREAMGEIVRWWGSTHPEDYQIRVDTAEVLEARYRDPDSNLFSITVPREGGAVDVTWRSDPVADTPGWWWAALGGFPVLVILAIALTVASRRSRRWSMYPGGKKPVVPPPKWQRR